MDKLKNLVKKEIDDIVKEGIDGDNLDALFKMVDIHKDIVQEEQMNMEMEECEMRYGNYGRGYRGEYNDGNYGAYGRRGVDRRYSAGNNYGTHPAIERMGESYSAYREANDEVNRGNYGAKNEKMDKLEIMLDSCLEFWENIVRENTDPESVEMIRHYMKKMQEI